MSSGPLSPLADPLALAQVQVLLIPVHRSGADPVLTEGLYEHWSKLFRKHQTLRGDEIVHAQAAASSHRRGAPDSPRARFLPSAPGSSISRTASASHVHLAFPSQPPARHLYPLSLLRMSAFPLVVIGVAVDDSDDEETQGFSLSETPSKSSEAKVSMEAWGRTFDHALSTFLPSTAAFPLVKRLVLVSSHIPQAGTPQRSPARNNSGQAPWKSVEGSVRRAPFEGGDSWVGRLLGEVVGEVFAELGDLATSLESPAGLKTLGSTLLPCLSMPDQDDTEAPSPARTPTTSRPSSVTSPRLSSLGASNSLPLPSASPGARALTPGGRPTSVQPPSAPPIQSKVIAPSASPPASMSSNPFRRSTALTSPFQRSTSTGSISGAKDVVGVAKYTSASLGGVAGGRLLKLLGDMYLLTGMYSDAIKCYDDGAERSRAVGDVLWEAQAREGRAVAGIGEAWQSRDGSTLSTPFPSSSVPVDILSHLLSSLACLSRAPLPFPPTILSPAPQSAQEPISQRPPSSPTLTQVGTGEGLLAWLYSSLCLRISHFTLIIFASGGWGSIAVSSLVAHSLPRSFPALDGEHNPTRGRSRRLALTQLALQSQLSRHSILGHGEAALGSFRLAMTKAEQAAVFVEIVRLARWLDMERKEASATLELVKLLASLIVDGRDENKRCASQAARLGEEAEAAGLATAQPGGSDSFALQQAVAVRRRETTDGNAGIISLLERACAVLGVDLLSLDTSTDPHPSSVQVNDDDDFCFGWPDLQVEAVKEATSIAEALQDSPSVVKLCISALRSLYGYLSPQHQLQLAKLYPAALSTMRRRALDIGPMPWWLPGRVVLSIEISSLAPNKTPFEHSRADLAPDEAQGKKDPFLYNPRLKAPDPGTTILVAGEQVDVYVTLQNVFAFDLEVQDLSLLTSGSPFITSPLPLVLPASSVQTVRVSGVAPTSGRLKIKGVHLRLMDGSEAEFLLPVSEGVDATRDSKQRSQIRADAGKTKRQGLEARHSVVIPSEFLHSMPLAERDDCKWLECTVIESQPLLWIKKTSLSHGTVMLYDGEKSVIQITLENSSQVPVDFVRLSFDDSVTREAQHVLLDVDIAPEQAFELQQDISERPVFAWDSGTDLSIPPGGRATISVRILGKVGCTDGTIRIDYGYVNRGDNETSATLHTRRLTFPVLFTVYRTLECFALDVACLRPSESHLQAKQRLMNGSTPRNATFATSSDEELRRALVKNDDRSVLFCLNVSNVFSVPFEIALGTSEDREDGLVVTRLVPPGATERLVLPIPRQALSIEERSKPIPSTRQYLVDKRRTPAEAARHRELFWFREKLLSMVHMSWREPGSLRSGSVSLRDQAVSPGHIDNFRIDEVSVALVVEPRSQSLSAMDFVDLRIIVTNNLEREVRPYVRLEALPTSSNDTSWSVPAPPPAPRRVSSLPAAPQPVPKTVAFDGVLASTLATLAPGESASHAVGAALLASGSYTFRAAAEEVGMVDQSDAPPNITFSPSVTVDVAE